MFIIVLLPTNDLYRVPLFISTNWLHFKFICSFFSGFARLNVEHCATMEINNFRMFKVASFYHLEIKIVWTGMTGFMEAHKCSLVYVLETD